MVRTMKIGLRCPAHVSSVEQTLQYALVAHGGGGRFWLTSQSATRSILLGASLLGNGFPLPLGIVVPDGASGREIARQASELARLAGQRVVLAWAADRSSDLEEFRAETLSDGTSHAIAGAVLSPSRPTTANADASLSFTSRYLPDDVNVSDAAVPDGVAYADFLFFDVPQARRSAGGRATYESGVVERLQQLSVPLGIGQSTLDRVDEQEFVIGVEEGHGEVDPVRELLVLERAMTEASEFVASARALRAREIFGW